MPEGHTVHRVARHFREEFVGHALRLSSPQGRFSQGATVLDGRKLNDATAVGKQLFLTFEGGTVLRVHLGMYGAWTFISRAGHHSMGAPRVLREEGLTESESSEFPPDPVGQVRVRISGADVIADLRGPTACEVITEEQAQALREALGPDPLVDRGTKGLERFIERMHSTSTPIALALMNQRLVAGIGNVYRAELLFRHRLDPFVPANELSRDTLAALWGDWATLLKKGVATGVMVTRNDLTQRQQQQALTDQSFRHFVYKRNGEPCLVCGRTIQLREIGARKLFYCPHCQVDPARS